MEQAVAAWMQANEATAAPAKDHTFFDCDYAVTGSHTCNPTCG